MHATTQTLARKITQPSCRHRRCLRRQHRRRRRHCRCRRHRRRRRRRKASQEERS